MTQVTKARDEVQILIDENDKYCRGLMTKVSRTKLPHTPAAFGFGIATICIDLCDLAYALFAELGFDPQREIVPSERVSGGGLNASAAVLAEAGERFVVIDLPLLKVIAIRIDDIVFVCFRGTKLWRDWKLNANTRKVRLDEWWEKRTPIWAHAGFVQVMGGIDRALADALTRWQPADRPMEIVVCGHSQGGAIAMLAASALTGLGGRMAHMMHEPVWRLFRVLSVYSFGAPRWGVLPADFLSCFPHYRLVNEKDPVPSVPAARQGFAHDCEGIIMSDSGRIIRFGDTGSLAKLGWSWLSGRTAQVAEHHFIEAYRARVDDLATQFGGPGRGRMREK